MGKQKSLKKILILSFILIISIPMGVVSVLTLRNLTQELKDEIITKNQLLSKSISSQIEEFLKQPKNMIHRIAFLAGKKKLIEKSKIIAYLSAYVETYPYFDMIQVIDTNGRVKYMAPYDANYIENDMSQQTFFKMTAEKTMNSVWSPVFISIQKGQPTVAISETTEDGMIIVGYLNLKFLTALIHKFFMEEKSQIAILDKDGNFIAHTNLKYVNERQNIKNLKTIQLGLVGNELTQTENVEEQDKLVSVSLIYSTGWLAAVFQSEEQAFETVHITRLIIFIGILLALLSGMGISFWSLKNIFGSVENFRLETQRIGNGDYHSTFEKTSLKEFEGLGEDIQTMAQQIAQRERALLESQETLQEMVKEKEILLKEIHHRVKNNLQVISSLLSLQASYVTDVAAGRALKEAQNRIQSISLVHQKIYQNQNLAQLDFKNYIEDLLCHIKSTFNTNNKNIQVKSNIEKTYLDLDTSIYCSLIINEIMTNAYKYAFQGREDGVIAIDFTSTDNALYQLTISDDGIGLPKEFDFSNPKTLGLDLVNGLVESLDGKVEIFSEHGTCFQIQFKKKQ